MKIILILSLALNIVLTYSLLRKKEAPQLERFRFEHIGGKRKIFDLPQHSLRLPTRKSQEQIDQENREKVDEISKKVSRDRHDFLNYELGLDQNKLDQIEMIKEAYMSKFIKVAPPTSHGHLTQKQRQKLLEIEKEREKEFIKLMGKGNWEKFQSFKKYYNKNLNKEFSRDSHVVVPLDI
jgi:hypothetical protein